VKDFDFVADDNRRVNRPGHTLLVVPGMLRGQKPFGDGVPLSTIPISMVKK
jgi:hypothetical protein